MRITDLFKGKKKILANPEKHPIKIYRTDKGYCSEYFAGSLNCMKNSRRLLE